ncbi:hypothetical protein H0H93_013613 [Arthromyces matolae]|nr:hypothetical protein H0H93_013613 [Arthromyces matolae]
MFFLDRLHYEILAFLAYMEQTNEEKKVREVLLEDIRKIVAQLYGDATIHLFGSSVTGLNLPISDLDVSVKAPHIRNVRKALFQFSNRLTVRGLTDRASVAVGAPVPIITFETTPSRGSIHVDININDESDVKGTEIIQTYISQMPALRPLVLLMKTFLLQRGLNNASRGGLGSYALANPGNRSSEEINDPMTSQSLGVLLRDFLFYYGTQFDYETTYISTSVAPGKELKKDADANEGKFSRLSNSRRGFPANDD